MTLKEIPQEGMVGPKIIGSTTIDHNQRVKMKLNCSEYVMISFLNSYVEKSIKITVEECYRKTGFVEEEQYRLLTALQQKAFVVMSEGNVFEITSKWKTSFSSYEDEFEKHFWVIAGSNAWPGSKKQAKDNYIKARKKHPIEFLMNARNDYFEYLDACHSTGFMRQKMMASVFLGPQERYLENWKKQTAELLKLHKPERKTKTAKPVSAKDVKQLYEKDNNQ